jgi:hypothetical protein
VGLRERCCTSGRAGLMHARPVSTRTQPRTARSRRERWRENPSRSAGCPPSQDGNEIFFKIKKSTPFRKLMDAYCKRQGTDENGILFLVDGKRLRPEQTPDEVRQHPVTILLLPCP